MNRCWKENKTITKAERTKDVVNNCVPERDSKKVTKFLFFDSIEITFFWYIINSY